MEKEAGTAVVTRPDVDELMERAQASRPPDLEPVGQCPYCHHDLVKRDVQQRRDVRTARIGERVAPAVLLTFWACTNEECCLMFWRHPRTPMPQKFQLGDDMLEH